MKKVMSGIVLFIGVIIVFLGIGTWVIDSKVGDYQFYLDIYEESHINGSRIYEKQYAQLQEKISFLELKYNMDEEILIDLISVMDLRVMTDFYIQNVSRTHEKRVELSFLSDRLERKLKLYKGQHPDIKMESTLQAEIFDALEAIVYESVDEMTMNKVILLDRTTLKHLKGFTGVFKYGFLVLLLQIFILFYMLKVDRHDFQINVGQMLILGGICLGIVCGIVYFSSISPVTFTQAVNIMRFEAIQASLRSLMLWGMVTAMIGVACIMLRPGYQVTIKTNVFAGRIRHDTRS